MYCLYASMYVIQTAKDWVGTPDALNILCEWIAKVGWNQPQNISLSRYNWSDKEMRLIDLFGCSFNPNSFNNVTKAHRLIDR